MKKLEININSHSIAGIKTENQDACAYYLPKYPISEYKGISAVIADGVSACEKAKEASACCVQSFLTDYYSTPESWRVVHSASKVISALNNWLHSQSIYANDTLSMLSTLSILIVKSNTAHIFHIGDSRIYRYRDSILTQLTKDHIIKLNKEKTYLSRAMGFDLNVSVDYQTFNIKTNDKFLMTTDGVHDYLDNIVLQKYMQKEYSAKDIVNQALKQNSLDNISAMIVHINQLPEKKLNEAFNELTKKPVPPDLINGMKINGFEVQSLITSSAKMQLYLAKDINTNQKVALKTPSVNFEDDVEYLQSFTHEQWVGQRINSPYVVEIYQNFEPVKFLAYAMKYIEGRTLRKWMDENTKPDIKTVINIVKQLVQGIRAFHRQEMLHCDLKPENIMIDNNNNIKLIDFGSTRIAGVVESFSPINLETNQGTQGYTAPEVMMQKNVSRFSEQFSLAIIVYEMFSSHLPYQDKLTTSLNDKKLSKIIYQSLLIHCPSLPIWIDGAIRKACSLEVNNRYNVLSKFLYDLEHPNANFLQPENLKKIGFGAKEYKLFIGLSLILNFILLLSIINYEL